MEQNEFDVMMENWLARQRRQESAQSRAVRWAVDAGLTDGAAGQAFVTREETLQLLHGALDHFFRQLIAALRDTTQETAGSFRCWKDLHGPERD